MMNQAPRRRLGRTTKSGLIVAVIFLISSGTCEVLAAACENFPTPSMTLKFTKAEVTEVFDLTAEDLRKTAASRGIQPHWPALGAYTSDIVYAANIFENSEKEGDGLYCATVASVDVAIELKNRVIHLAQELRQDRCLEEGQRQHLREHARADAEAIEEFPALSELRNAFAKIHTSQAPSVAAAKAQVTAAVHEKIKELLDEIDGHRAELNQKIDAPEAIDTLRRRVETGALTGCH